jgi:hypothetical protein
MQTKGIYANQVVTRIHANQGHCYANQVVTEIHANQGHFMQTGQIYTENPSTSLYGIAWERKEKGTKRENGQRKDNGQE